jgi:hypothetical protein
MSLTPQSRRLVEEWVERQTVRTPLLPSIAARELRERMSPIDVAEAFPASPAMAALGGYSRSEFHPDRCCEGCIDRLTRSNPKYGTSSIALCRAMIWKSSRPLKR